MSLDSLEAEGWQLTQAQPAVLLGERRGEAVYSDSVYKLELAATGQRPGFVASSSTLDAAVDAAQSVQDKLDSGDLSYPEPEGDDGFVEIDSRGKPAFTLIDKDGNTQAVFLLRSQT